MLMGRAQTSVAQNRAVVPQQQRHGPVFGLFALWLLSLPFYRYSVFGTYSLDNLLAPVVCLAAIFLPRLQDSRIQTQRIRVIVLVSICYLVYVTAGLIAWIGGSDMFWSRAWQSLRDGLYILAPLLYIRDCWSWNMTKGMVVVCTLVAAASVFMASTGLIEFEVVRFETSRVGIEWLPKAIGLFSSYGDVAMLYGFTVVVLITHRRDELCCGMGHLWFRLMAAAVLMLGVAGSQSRNVVLSTLAALGAYYVLVRFRKAKANLRLVMAVFILLSALLAGAVLVLFGGDLVEGVSGWGGENAYQTAHTRLESYRQAIELITAEPFFGVSLATYKTWGGLVDGIHNMWLRVLLQRGYFGFVALAAIFVLAFRCGMGGLSSRSTDYDRESQLALAALTAIAVAVEFYPGLSDTFRIMLSIVLASCWVVGAKKESAGRG